MKDTIKKGFYFKTYEAPFQSPFEKLFAIFKELITHTSGDFDEAIDWLRELDKEYKLTDEHYTIDDFIEDLKKKGYIRDELKDDGTSGTGITAKTERAIRQQALDNILEIYSVLEPEITKPNKPEVATNTPENFANFISETDWNAFPLLKV